MSHLDWKVGDRVVCIATSERIAAMQAQVPGSNYPTSGGVYTIREIRDDAPWRGGEHHIVLLLAEIDNSHFLGKHGPRNTYCYVEPGFSIRGFRKVQPRKTDISIFEAILHGARVPEDA